MPPTPLAEVPPVDFDVVPPELALVPPEPEVALEPPVPEVLVAGVSDPEQAKSTKPKATTAKMPTVYTDARVLLVIADSSERSLLGTYVSRDARKIEKSSRKRSERIFLARRLQFLWAAPRARHSK